MKVSAEIEADSATPAGLQITQFSARMALNGDRLALSPLSFSTLRRELRRVAECATR